MQSSRAALVAALLLSLGACSGTTSTEDAADTPGTPTAASVPASPATSPGAAAPSPTPSPTPTPTPTPTPEPVELPGGGTEVFPDTRLVGFAGYPGAPALGRMGVGDLDDRVEEMVEVGEDYTAGGRRTLPALELITTVVHSSPQRDGSYRTRIDEQVIEDHLEAARRHDALLLLNLQPGRADMVEEVQHYEKWLSEPDVGVALDPEWAVGEDEVPGRVFGSTTGAELDEIAGWLDELTEREGLPEKVMLYHQLRVDIVDDPEDLQAEDHENVAVVVSIDGIGSPGAKRDTYEAIAETVPDGVHFGFKLFYEEDAEGPSRLMTPEEVMDLEPRPEYVLYE
ncbi:hypothetical protein [Auraticoccus monumenti]|uniref:Lipoprotein n=1 Tax=Auraticoccus monumenti TaxID=675864 RepID=A0A1G7BPG8_9ACTN|nr:hypothetical protein [Auraticoccus monumenti]SDE28580.1 hypothetical protein SAMN04489747_3015 [Auraticoccus monumenti]